MSELEARSGPVRLTWDPDARWGVVRFAEPGTGGRPEAEELAVVLDEWLGSPPQPFRMLVDAGQMVDVDAGWRAAWGQFFRERRDAATLAWFDANARLRLLILMFRKGTGVHGRAFETEDEAVAWLHDQAPHRG